MSFNKKKKKISKSRSSEFGQSKPIAEKTVCFTRYIIITYVHMSGKRDTKTVGEINQFLFYSQVRKYWLGVESVSEILPIWRPQFVTHKKPVYWRRELVQVSIKRLLLYTARPTRIQNQEQGWRL